MLGVAWRKCRGVRNLRQSPRQTREYSLYNRPKGIKIISDYLPLEKWFSLQNMIDLLKTLEFALKEGFFASFLLAGVTRAAFGIGFFTLFYAGFLLVETSGMGN